MAAAGPSLAVAAVVVSGGHLLLVERGRPPAAGKWSVPGGRVEAGETLEEALRREVREETGVEVEPGQLLGFVERAAEGHHFVILDFAASAAAGAEEVVPVPGDDAVSARWVPVDEVAVLPLVSGLGDFLADHGVL